jgi:TrmH family RNA methyltransferase
MITKNQLKLVHQLEQKKIRQREQLFVAEGPKVVGDLLQHGYHPTLLFATENWGPDTILVTEEELRRLSFLQHPQQVLAVFPIPSDHAMHLPEKGELCLALDGVQDPGNLGTIIRIADWFGIQHIYCSQDTADVWNPKVIQATMGSIARVHIYYCNLEKLISGSQLPVYGTLLDGNDIYQQPLSADGIIVMGNEGKGISVPIRQLITRKLLIPNFSTQADTAESLNVAIATAITCSEFRRR